MSEERLQEIKDSISLQYKVQEANDLHSFNIFTDEEQELVEEIDRLNNIINELEKYLIEHIDEYRDMEQDAMFEFGLVLDKLKELKENK